MQSYLFCLILLALPFTLLAMPNRMDNGNSPKVIILLGAPASGKGTQSKRLAEEFNIPHISTGDLFRENISKETALGKKAKGYIEAGNLVPDELVLEMLFDRLKQSDAANGYILDGTPRTIAQAKALDEKLGNQPNITVLNLDVSDDTIMKRTSGRLVCKGCGSMYNRYFSPPKCEGVCDKCGGELQQRQDDRPEVVMTRLKAYHEQTEPLIEYYQNKGTLIEVNGEQPADQVFQELKNAIISSQKTAL